MFKKFLNIFSNNSKTEIIPEIILEIAPSIVPSIEDQKIESYAENIQEEKIELSEEEINIFIEQEVREQISSVNFNSTENSEGSGYEEFDTKDRDIMFEDAARLIVLHQQGSTSLIQRKLKLGYNRAGRILDQLEHAGILGPFEGSKARQVLISDSTYLEKFLSSNMESARKKFFRDNILPFKQDIIETQVKDHNKKLEVEREQKLKEILKQEILEKEWQRIEKEKRKNLKKQIMQEMAEEGLIQNNSILKREQIPQETQDKVWNRDGGKCVKCESQDKLEFDHIIPFSKGGSNSYRNLQLLCETCNRQKSNKIG